MGSQSFPGFLLLLFSFLVLNQQRNFKKQVAILLLCNQAGWVWYHRCPLFPFVSFSSSTVSETRGRVRGFLFLFFLFFFFSFSWTELYPTCLSIIIFLAPTNDLSNQGAFLYFLYPSFGFLRASQPRVGMYLHVGRYLPQPSSATTRLIKFLFLSCNLSWECVKTWKNDRIRT